MFEFFKEIKDSKMYQVFLVLYDKFKVFQDTYVYKLALSISNNWVFQSAARTISNAYSYLKNFYNTKIKNDNKSLLTRLAEVYSMPITQKVIALTFPCIALLTGGIGVIPILVVCLTLATVVAVQYYEQKRFMQKKILLEETKYLSDYIKSKEILGNFKQLSEKLGIRASEDKLSLAVSKPKKNFAYAISVLSTLSSLRPLILAAVSLNIPYLCFAVVETLVTLKTRFSKFYRDEVCKSLTKEYVNIVKRDMKGDISSTEKLAKVAMDEKLDALAIQELASKFPKMQDQKQLMAKFKEIREGFSKNLKKEGIYSDDTMTNLKNIKKMSAKDLVRLLGVSNADDFKFEEVLKSKEFIDIKKYVPSSNVKDIKSENKISSENISRIPDTNLNNIGSQNLSTQQRNSSGSDVSEFGLSSSSLSRSSSSSSNISDISTQQHDSSGSDISECGLSNSSLSRSSSSYSNISDLGSPGINSTKIERSGMSKSKIKKPTLNTDDNQETFSSKEKKRSSKDNINAKKKGK